MKSSVNPVLVIAIMIASTAASCSVRAQDVRVRLFDLNEPVTILLSAHEGPIHLYAGEHTDPLTGLAAGETAHVSRTGAQLHVAVDDLKLYAESVRVEPADDALFGIEIEEGSAQQELRRYDGRLFISADESESELRLVNEVPLDDYVASVVASEYGFDDLEGSKAMAVLVRTYTLGVLGTFDAEYDHVDHTLSQVYRGVDQITPVSRRAAYVTEGEVLTYGSDLIRAVYFASSGGHTADNETVWEGPPLPYLRGKPDPYGDNGPHARWTARISRPRLLAELRSTYDRSVEGFVISDRARDGRVANVDLLLADGSRRTIGGNDFRLLVTQHFGARSVRSTFFDARREGDEYVFEGRGFGHGVGLSQWGARDMALRGMSYTEILDFYYSDVELSRLDGVPERAALTERDVESEREDVMDDVTERDRIRSGEDGVEPDRPGERERDRQRPDNVREERDRLREEADDDEKASDVPARLAGEADESDPNPRKRRRIGW